jgi:hypothetical protein
MNEAVIGIIGLIVGALIGSTGIGGVLLAPALDVFSSKSVHDAVPICMFAFVFSGLAGTALYARYGVIEWRWLMPLSIGAAPAAFFGAAAVPFVPAALLKFAIAAMVIAAGVQALSVPRNAGSHPSRFGDGTLLWFGAVVGFGSSLTGTGGPLILIPILLVAGAEVRQAVGLAQAIQIPIAVFATANNLVFARIDLRVAVPVTIAVVAGVYLGSSLARRSSAMRFRAFIGVTLVAAGLFYAGAAALSVR